MRKCTTVYDNEVIKSETSFDALHHVMSAQSYLYSHDPYPREPRRGDAEAIDILRTAENRIRHTISNASFRDKI